MIRNNDFGEVRSSVTRLGDLLDFGPLLKPLATIYFSKSPTFLGNFCKIVKIYHFLVKSFLGIFFIDIWLFFLVALLVSPTASVRPLNLIFQSNHFQHSDQCDQMVKLCFPFLAFTAMKICQTAQKVCPSRFTIRKKFQSLKIFFQSGEISPNLVTLILH